ncbi:ABC transporter permease [Cellulomonas bogoriensis]|uniref:ABC transporter permease n=1 Tax=Cellulomonas bogoriensis TaxID=301388 RepID=UPI00068DC703|nr:ABC transporter permease [Cellulomonas bogoriensis]
MAAQVTAPVGARDGRTAKVPVLGPWSSVTGHWLVKYRRMWAGTAVSSFLAPLMYLAGMGLGLGALLDQGVGGVPYVTFIAPGLLAATALQTGAGETTFSVMGSIKWNPIYQGMLATPLGPRDVVTGHLVFVAIRVLVVSVVFFAVAAALGAVPSWWGVLAVPVAALGGVAFAACCYAYSATLSSDKGLVLVMRFVVMPMMLFSGTFFPVEQLPGYLQPVAWATPLWHAVEASRALTLGVATTPVVAGHVAYLLLWLVVGWWLSGRVLRRRMVV